MKAALIDPSLFTIPYDVALGDALNRQGCTAIIYGRRLRSFESAVGITPIKPFFYRHSDGKAKVAKGIEHSFNMLGLPLSTRHFDVIHFQWCPLPLVDRGVVAFLRRFRPVIYTVHDITPYNDVPVSQFQKAGLSKLLDTFDHLIVHSQSSKRTLTQRGLAAEKISVIPHGILDRPESTIKKVCKPYKTLLMFGAIQPYKGIDRLFNAFEMLPQHLKDKCRIKIVGNPKMDLTPLLRQIDRLGLGAYVQWDLRYVPEDEVSNILAEGDIYVFPYREIDASGVFMSSIPFGKPIIATRAGVFEQLIKHGENGLLVDNGDTIGFFEALRKLIENENLCQKLGAAIKQTTVSTWDEIARLTMEVYRSSCKPKKLALH